MVQPRVKQFLLKAKDQLSSSPTPSLDAEVILSHVLGKPRAYLYAWPEKLLTSCQIEHLDKLIDERKKGEPIAYLVGHKEFWSLDLTVTPQTLIPRPETETLVEIVLQLAFPKNESLCVADLGTGSGAIALAIASERPNWKVVAADVCPLVLETAKQNANQLKLNNIEFKLSNWCQALADDRFDVIVSNPPYIAKDDAYLNEGDVRFEPCKALISGDDGLEDIRNITFSALHYLKTGGYLFFEHGCNQGDQARKILENLGYQDVRTHKDLAGLDRVTQGIKTVK